MFTYYDVPPPIPSCDAAVCLAVVPANLRDERTLVLAISKALSFPPYYGANYDALWDGLTYFENIASHKIILAHCDAPALPVEEQETYIALLRDAVLFWQDNSVEHIFEAWFPRKCKDMVDALLRASPPPAFMD